MLSKSIIVSLWKWVIHFQHYSTNEKATKKKKDPKLKLYNVISITNTLSYEKRMLGQISVALFHTLMSQTLSQSISITSYQFLLVGEQEIKWLEDTHCWNALS